MKPAAITILALILVIAVVDTILFVQGGTVATISHTMLEWSYDYPIFTFSMGVIIGHLFWRIRDTKHTEKMGKSDD